MGRACAQNRRSRRLLGCVSTAFVLCLVAFVLGSALVAVFEWRRSSSSSTSVSSTSAADTSCLSCHCPVKPQRHPLRSHDERDLCSVAACRKTDPSTKEELPDRVALLNEQIDLHKTVARDSLKRTEAAIGTLKKASARFQSEALKCKACVETCEKGRERAEVALVKERRFTELWEKRAHGRGWRDDTAHRQR